MYNRIDASKSLRGRLEEGAHIFLAGDVGPHAEGRFRRTDLSCVSLYGSGFRAVAPAAEDDAIALGDGAQDASTADSARTAGHNDNIAF
jgi:hypothetical protein